jgi:NAD(P)-dependent dehydrogenase (short-subunit alcohol dehydrogenase family)
VRALVTGAGGGIGRALTARLRDEGYDVLELDLPGFDVTRPESWETLEAGFDLGFLNAGIVTPTGGDLTGLTDESYRRTVGVNVDGVVFGVRALASRMNDGGAIVATASLAGLMEVEGDPVYALTKHAVVGFVRSAAPQLERRGIRLNAVCPGLVDTPMVDAMRPALGDFPLIPPSDVAEAALRAARSEGSGEAWIVQPGTPGERYRFRGVPGPRTAGAEGLAPPMPT